MDLEPEFKTSKRMRDTEFTQLLNQQPLELLKNTEGLLRRQTVGTLVPILPRPLGKRLQAASFVADETLDLLAAIDLDKISDFQLQPARILVGLSFIGFGALAIALLILYLYALHPKLSSVEQIHKYWHLYVWFVGLGVAGMFMLGREAMRPLQHRNATKSSFK